MWKSRQLEEMRKKRIKKGTNMKTVKERKL